MDAEEPTYDGLAQEFVRLLRRLETMPFEMQLNLITRFSATLTDYGRYPGTRGDIRGHDTEYAQQGSIRLSR